MKISDIHFHRGELFEPEEDNKEWGSEYILDRGYNRFKYCVKVMTLKPGYQVSLHIHQHKQETFVLVEGHMIIKTFTQKGDYEEFTLTEKLSTITLDPMTPHTFYAPDDQKGVTVFLEVSTPDSPSDSYRITKSGPRKLTCNR